MLSRADLETIRAIVREELERLLPAPVAEEGVDDDASENAEANPDPDDELLREWASASVARLRGVPGAAEREDLAEARYRIASNSQWHMKRARKMFGKGAEDPVTAEEMREAIATWRANRKRRKPA